MNAYPKPVFKGEKKEKDTKVTLITVKLSDSLNYSGVQYARIYRKI